MGLAQRVIHWRPRPARAALLLGAAALPAAGLATGIVALPVAAAACLAGAVVLPRSRARVPAETPAGRDDELDVHVAIDSLLGAIRGRVPPEVWDQVARICALAAAGLEARPIEALAAPDPDCFKLRQTVLSYLPGALDAYLAVPGIYAEKALRGRKSPHRTLLDELNLIEETCRRLTEGAVEADADRLEAHGRYLQAALGRSRLTVDASDPAQSAAQPAERERTRG